jgi:Carboxypeptidase regulatory-like domain
MKKGLFLGLALVLAVVPGAWAQLSTGNIYGAVTDESGAVLPGATISISGATTGGRSTTAGSQGDFRFLNLDPGRYKLTVALTGFTTVNREVIVNTGSNVNLTFGLKVATVEETVTVTAETPVVDTKKLGTDTRFTQEELTQTPNARDPWGLLRSVPGVLVDRVNIAGNESGQQASFVGKGSDNKDNTFNMDGVSITDLAAVGASPTYYDQDAFQEITITTGGTDLKTMTGGVGVNFVTKRGTNSFKGTLRGYLTHDDLQSSNLPGEVASHTLPSGAPDNRLKNPDGSFRDKADHIQQISDYGFDLGGPIIKDKLWFWGSYGKQDIRLVRFAGTADKTILKDYNGKLNWQASQNDMISAFYFNGKKLKFGRAPSYPLQLDDGVLYDQAGAYSGGPQGLWKFEWNHVFSPKFFVNAKYAWYNQGFGFTPHGGDTALSLDYVNGFAHGSSQFYHSLRPQHTVQIDSNYFASGMGGQHEFKFGFFFKNAKVNSSSGYGGNKIVAKIQPTESIAVVWRDLRTGSGGNSYSGWIGDTFTKGQLTLNLGARFDHQKVTNLASSTEANPAFPDLVPGLDFPGGGTGVEWNTISPRVGLTYALNESRKTILRASYARYAGQLPLGDGSYDNPLSYTYIAYGFNDLNGDGFAQPNEVLVGDGPLYYSGIDPNNPNAGPNSPNKIDPNYKANIDNEFIVGLDHELAANLAVGVAYTYRKSTKISYKNRIGITPADFTANDPTTFAAVDGKSYTGQTFSPNSDLVDAANGGRILTNIPGYNRQFNGLELNLVKRLANKWMSRVAVAYNNWTEHFPDGPVGNPSRFFRSNSTPGPYYNPQEDGGQVTFQGGGSGKSQIYSSSKWTFSANALYQLPWALEISGALYGRQGYLFPVYLNLPADKDGTLSVLGVPSVDTERLDKLWNLDLRLAKNMKLGNTNLVLSAEAFNVLNNDLILARTLRANTPTFRRADEVLNPRVVRFGIRYAF